MLTWKEIVAERDKPVDEQKLAEEMKRRFHRDPILAKCENFIADQIAAQEDAAVMKDSPIEDTALKEGLDAWLRQREEEILNHTGGKSPLTVKGNDYE